MYKLSLIKDDYELESKPTSMYKMKNYCDDLKSENNQKQITPEALRDLLAKQNSFLARLQTLESKIDLYIKEKSVRLDTIQQIKSNQIKRVTKKQSSKTPFREIAIQVDPKQIPLSLFVQFNKLSLSYKCFLTFLTHSSVVDEVVKNVECKRIGNAFSSAQQDKNEPRSSYDFGITIIWKRVENGPRMKLETSTSVAIQGEANILRYMERLMNKQALQPEDNDLIDQCTNAFNSTNNRSQFIKLLNDKLAKFKYLGNQNEPNLADIYVWSVLKQNQTLIKGEKKIQEWLGSFKTNDLFNF